MIRALGEAMPDTQHRAALGFQKAWDYGWRPAALPLAELIDDGRLPGKTRADAKEICRLAAEDGDDFCAAQLGTWLTGEVVAQAVNATSATVPDHVDEFALAGLTPAPSERVAPPRVAESPVAFECRLTQLIRLTDVEGAPVDAWLTLGEVVMVHIDRALLVDGVYDTVAAEPILRGGGPADYFGIEGAGKFQMHRPT